MTDPHWGLAEPARALWHGAGSATGGLSGLDDAAVLRRIAGGDQGALGELYRRLGQVMFAQILLAVGERAMSEEILQDSMLAIWRGAGSFRGESTVRSWAVSIARRQARDRTRRHRPRVVDDTYLAELPSREPGPESTALDRAEARTVAEAIRTLSQGHREVLGLAFGAGLTLPEVAEVLQVPLGTVKSRLTAARTALGRALSERGYDR
ncbi:MAG TPA: sigma-70 family RNA polymerase sigma factor [Actinocrinis sp.]